MHRPRRLRRTATLRRLVAETRLSVDQLVYPLFITAGHGIQSEIGAMPGQFRWSLDRLGPELEQIAELGVPAVLFFGIPAEKDLAATGAWHDQGVVQQALRLCKQVAPDLLAVADTCLCEYTSHGHCGLLDDTGAVLNDPTLELLTRTAVAQAAAGADIIAPSDMMDGRIGAIRTALDAAGFDQVAILSYAAKYASAFYGPFREAADSAPAFGDRRGYQMDPPNRREALKEVLNDVAEGADLVMVKPALAYLDIIREVRNAVDLPLAAYQVSGEYSMVKAAAAAGWVDERRAALETLTSISRAGADILITYWAKDLCDWLR
ncbi:MAG: porphobilinogen synthase [Fimbriimonadaceae bacterium]|nr:porphobilinogen synthase [Fimbriimonadaceae bacterium]